MMQSWQRLSACALLVALISCGDRGPRYYPIAGEVTLDGQPLAEGTIMFYDAAGASDAAVAPISAGAFAGEATAGDKRVEVHATRIVPGKMQESALGGEPSPVRESLIPERYNRRSTLKATVAAGGENKFRFELTSDGVK